MSHCKLLHHPALCWLLVLLAAIMSGPVHSAEPSPAGRLYGLEFDGQDDYVKVASFLYDGSYPITIEAIAVPRSDKKGSVFVDFEAAGIGLHLREARWMFNVSDDGKYRVAAANAKSDFKKADHLAGVFDGKRVMLYVNGVLQKKVDVVAGPVKPSALPLLVGANPAPGGGIQECFHGRIDAVRLSKGVLYSKDFKPPRSFEKGDSTLILLNFEEGEGDKAADESGNGYHATIHGAKWVRLDGQ